MEDSSRSVGLPIYKKFIIAGFGQTILGRGTSIFYIIIISRLVAPKIYDFVVILAGVQFAIVTITAFGFRYSGTHFLTLNEDNREDISSSTAAFTIYFGIPISILLWEILLQFLIFTNNVGRLGVLSDDIHLRVMFDLSTAISIMRESLSIRLFTKLKNDQIAWLDTINSVGQSIFIPLFFWVSPKIVTFFYAWMFVSIISFYYWRKEIVEIFVTNINFPLIKKLLKFGLPVFLVMILNIIGQYGVRYVLFFQFSDGDTTLYHWVLRVNETAYSVLMVMTIGLFPLLVQYSQNTSEEQLQNLNRRYFRLIAFLTAATFGSMVVSSRLILFILLPPEYQKGIFIFYLICGGFLLQAQTAFLSPQLQAYGGRKLFVIVSLLGSSLSIVLPLLLSKYGFNAIASTMLLTAGASMGIYILFQKKLKFKRKIDIVYPMLISIGLFMVSIVLSDITTSLSPYWLLIVTLSYLLFSYVIVRVTKIVGPEEISIILRIVPKGISPYLAKILL